MTSAEETSVNRQDEETIEIDLRNPGLAALLAWLWPGAGHLYQRRYAKGVLFMVCILGTYFFGLFLGGGRVVYASWKKEDRRWQYVCQFGVGSPALPAVVQNYLPKPLFQSEYYEDNLDKVRGKIDPDRSTVSLAFMAPPPDVVIDERDVLAKWHEKYSYFEIGTLYTMIAGLLNVLAIYDAFAGPVVVDPEEEVEKTKKKKT